MWISIQKSAVKCDIPPHHHHHNSTKLWDPPHLISSSLITPAVTANLSPFPSSGWLLLLLLSHIRVWELSDNLKAASSSLWPCQRSRNPLFLDPTNLSEVWAPQGFFWLGDSLEPPSPGPIIIFTHIAFSFTFKNSKTRRILSSWKWRENLFFKSSNTLAISAILLFLLKAQAFCN